LRAEFALVNKIRALLCYKVGHFTVCTMRKSTNVQPRLEHDVAIAVTKSAAANARSVAWQTNFLLRKALGLKTPKRAK
jgi:hypothetical protein